MGKTDAMLKTALQQPRCTSVLIIGASQHHCKRLLDRLIDLEGKLGQHRRVLIDPDEHMHVMILEDDLDIRFRSLHSEGAYWGVHRNVRVLIDEAAIPRTLVQLIRRNDYVGS
ncbi:MAG: hypothetical protein V3W41_14605 [Planctomycetota bacterium]